MDVLRIGNGAGFLGDRLDAPRLLAEAGGLDYLTLEYLAELTMSILARARAKDPQSGYARDFIEVLAGLCPALAAQPDLKVVTNAGGVNPRACAAAAARVLTDAKMDGMPIAVVDGDDLLPRLDELIDAGCAFAHFDTGEPLGERKHLVASANAYLGAQPIASALAAGARLVITGRVADASLTVGPAAHEFNWSWNDLDRLAGASVAGHIIECGAQASGGYLTDWQDVDLANVGYPVAEIAADGNCTVTKPAGTGGCVDRHSVAAQLVYEIGDPRHYLTPDVDVDFTTVEIEQLAPDRVLVRGARGQRPPDSYKVSLAYRDGFMASGQMLVYGRDCLAKARACAQIVMQRLARAGYQYQQHHAEYLGAGDGVPGLISRDDPPEVMLRLSVRDSRREAVERFTKEFAPLATSGPAGLAGYAAGRAPVREVLSYWPTVVPKDFVQPQVVVRTAREAQKE